jgi:hypothetical protein
MMVKKVQFLTNVNINIPALMAQGTISAFLSADGTGRPSASFSTYIRQSNSLSMPAADLLCAHKRAFVDEEERGLLCVQKSSSLTTYASDAFARCVY